MKPALLHERRTGIAPCEICPSWQRGFEQTWVQEWSDGVRELTFCTVCGLKSETFTAPEPIVRDGSTRPLRGSPP